MLAKQDKTKGKIFVYPHTFIIHIPPLGMHVSTLCILTIAACIINIWDHMEIS